jgi:hypothetical protein
MIIGLASAAALAACTSSANHPTSPTTPTTSSTQPAVTPPLQLPGGSGSSSAAPWSKDYAAGQFQDLLEQFNSASGGQSITASSSFADYLQYSQRIADACDPFLSGLRAGEWPPNAQDTIIAFTRLQQTVCDVELARGQAGTLEQYKGVPPPPADADQQLLTLRVQIYSELGI